MKIGDRIKFLSEVGGGKVAGFQGKNIVLVEDEDGFQIPTPINEVVVENGDDYSTASIINRRAEAQEHKAMETPLLRGGRSVKAMMQDGQNEKVDLSVADTIDPEREVTFRPQAEERRGGNQINACLAFVPMKRQEGDEPRFECYFINDCNYYLQLSYLVAEGNSWTLKFQDEAEPNTKVFIEEVGTADINELGHVAFQILAYKRKKPFLLKDPISVDFRIDPLKFYKLHAFVENPFFDAPTLMFTIVENDKPLRPLVVDPRQLRHEMYTTETHTQGANGNQPAQKVSQGRRDELVSRYPDDQRKGNRRSSPYIHHRGLDDAIVVDLHAEELLDSTAGMKPGDILEYQMKVFRDTLAKYAGTKGQKIIFIHGKGAGVLRQSITNELHYRYKSYTYQDASFQEYGYGATQVTIK